MLSKVFTAFIPLFFAIDVIGILPVYVAMTRARNELHLCAPLKYAVTQQAKNGDAHVYGAKSRFMSDKVLDTMEKISIRTSIGVESLKAGETTTVDVVAQLKEMW